jgi:biopolymer transport protein ExbD/biopolymer transport protein TolR
MGASLQTLGPRKQPEPDINVTPLVDVVLVLLIIFMVIAPALNEGEHIELPAIMKPDPKPRDLNPIKITMARSGALIIDDERIEQEQLKSKLEALHRVDPERALLLKADEILPYRQVRETFGLIQSIGFKGVQLRVLERKPAGTS